MSRPKFPCPVCHQPLESLLFDGEYKCGNGHVIAKSERDAFLFLQRGTNDYLEQLKERRTRISKGSNSYEGLIPPPRKKEVVPPPVPEECVVVGKPYDRQDDAVKEAAALKGRDPQGIYGTTWEEKSGWVVIKCSSMPANAEKTESGLIVIVPDAYLEEDE